MPMLLVSLRPAALVLLSLAALFAADPTPTATAPAQVTGVSYILNDAVPNNVYGVDGTIDFAVRFNAAVGFTSPGAGSPKPSLQLLIEVQSQEYREINNEAQYVSGENTSTLNFSYKVKAGDRASNLRYSSVNALQPGGVIIYTVGDTSVKANLTLPNQGAFTAKIDTQVPTVTSLTTTVNGGQIYGAPFDILVNFNEAIATLSETTKAGLKLRLNTGGYATYKSQSGSTITMTYTPQVGEETFLLNAADDLVSTTESGRLLIPADGAVNDLATPGNPTVIWVPTQGKPGALSEAKSIQIPVGGQLAKPLPSASPLDDHNSDARKCGGGAMGVLLTLAALALVLWGRDRPGRSR